MLRNYLRMAKRCSPELNAKNGGTKNISCRSGGAKSGGEAGLHHPDPDVLSTLEIEKIYNLAKTISKFIEEIRGDQRIYSCEIVFAKSRRRLLADDAFGWKSQFLLEDETYNEPGYRQLMEQLHHSSSAAAN